MRNHLNILIVARLGKQLPEGITDIDIIRPTMDMSQPLFPAPDGYIIDLANPQRRGVAANFWVGVVGMTLAAAFMGVRTYTKVVFAKSFSSDDGACMFISSIEMILTASLGALVLAWVRRSGSFEF